MRSVTNGSTIGVNIIRKEYIIEEGIKYEVQYTDQAKRYLLDGKLHREIGPAVEYYNGVYKYWWFNDREIFVKNNDEFLRWMRIKAFL